MKVIRRDAFREGRWRNGMGVSWDIASDSSAPDSFGWRFATARIDADVPFSIYPGVDRIFTLFEGGGVDFDFQGGGTLAVQQLHMPYPFSCDVPAFCRVRAGTAMALNLFTRREVWSATAEVLSSRADISHDGPILLFALSGASDVGGEALGQGDAAVTEGHVSADTEGFLFAARLRRA